MVCRTPVFLCDIFRHNVCQMSPFQKLPDSSVTTVINGALAIAE